MGKECIVIILGSYILQGLSREHENLVHRDHIGILFPGFLVISVRYVFFEESPSTLNPQAKQLRLQVRHQLPASDRCSVAVKESK